MNPFTAKAQRARALADRLSAPTAHSKAMADSFPLGVGFGRRGGEKRIEATITRAGKAVAAIREAEHLENLERLFAEGRVNAQGRMIDAASIARSDKRYAQQEKRQAKIDAAKAELFHKGRAGVSPETWATANGVLGGSGRELVMSDQREFLAAQAVTP